MKGNIFISFKPKATSWTIRRENISQFYSIKCIYLYEVHKLTFFIFYFWETVTYICCEPNRRFVVIQKHTPVRAHLEWNDVRKYKKYMKHKN